MNIYVASDEYGSLLIDVPISYIAGSAYYNASFNKQTNQTSPFALLFIDVSIAETGLDLISSRNVSINSTDNELPISLSQLTPRLDPYNITITGASGDGAQLYVSSTQLYYLPSRTDGGSTVKIDNLYGGLSVQNWFTNSTTWTPLFPYTYYVSWEEWLSSSIDDLNVFSAVGYNIIHIVPTGTLSNTPFPFSNLTAYIDRAEELGLWLMYDVRWNYRNLTPMMEQISYINSRKSLLAYYTADEPDGQTEPLNATRIAYDTIKAIDPYRPISLALNCYNFYFEEYSSGADIILSDVYPIAVNISWSNQYDTACNTTYGCCGCDDCEGKFEDVSKRFDLFGHHQDIIGGGRKPQWGAPQAFGNETFWRRYPTVGEEVVMNILSVNHGAKGIVMWDYPTEPGLSTITSALSKVLTTSKISSFLLGTQPILTLPVTGLPRIDVSAWIVGSQMLVNVVNLGYVDSDATVSVRLPVAVSAVGKTLWGNRTWVVEGEMLVKEGLEGLEVDLLVLEL